MSRYLVSVRVGSTLRFVKVRACGEYVAKLRAAAKAAKRYHFAGAYADGPIRRYA